MKTTKRIAIIAMMGVSFGIKAQAKAITDTGDKVGIGTTSPSQKLEVKGKVLLKSDSYVHYAIERENGAQSIHGITSNTHDAFLLSSGNLKFLTNYNGTSYNTAMFVNHEGNVGIGTVNPKAQMEISNKDYKQLMLSNHGSEKFYFGSVWSTVGSFISNNSFYKTSHKYTALDDVANGVQFRESGDIHLFSNTGLTINEDFLPTSRLTIKSNGNIGIGTTTPDSKLRIDDTYSLLRFDAINGQFRLRSTRLSGYDLSDLLLSAQGNLILYPDGGGSTFSGGGMVGIGTTNPDMKLTVKGNIHAEEVKIDLNVPAPDYVFKSDYKLRSLEEVESFIKEYSHLPEIPSAKEFAENGVMQAEMDMNLLKKIEELTLYTIQQQKEIEELKKLVKKILEDKN